MKKQAYKVKFEDSNSRYEFYDELNENIIENTLDHKNNKHSVIGSINNCTLTLEEDTSKEKITSANIELVHKKSLDEILKAKAIIEEKTGCKLEEVKYLK